MANKYFKKRILLISAGISFLLFALVCNLFYLQIIAGPELKQEAYTQQTRDEVVSANRGTISDRNGKVLAVSVTAETVIADPSIVIKSKKAEETAKKLSEILEMDYDKLFSVITKEKSQYEVIKRKIDPVTAEKIKEAKLKGITLLEDKKRNYTFGKLASQLIGFTGTDNQGLIGLENVFDSELKGKSGRVQAATASISNIDLPYENGKNVAPVDGVNIVLTMDEAIQHFAEKILEEGVEKFSVKEGAAAIVMDPRNGDVLAIACSGGFDLNSPFEIVDPAKSKELEVLKDEEYQTMYNKYLNAQWRNKAVSDSYEPGSVFKSVTAAAVVEENLVNMTETFDCVTHNVGGFNIKCWRSENPHGLQNITQALGNSCNPVFMDLGARLGATKFAEYFKAFGFTQSTGFALPGEAEGIYHMKLSEVDLAVSSFGQSFQVTPLQMISANCAIINGGKLYKPNIVKQFTDNDGNVVESFEPTLVREVISEETSEIMRGMLEYVVAEGTGKNAGVKGYRVGGKTGTSEKAPRGSGKKIASFFGFAPANDPQVAVLILFDEPTPDGTHTGQGGQVAAPTGGQLLADCLRHLDVPMQYNKDELLTLGVVVPETTGFSVEDASKNISNLKLVPKIMGKGTTVYDQIPKGMASLSEGGTVYLYTEDNMDKKMTTVPDVSKLPPYAAKQKILNAGLNYRVSSSGAGETNTAIAATQSPETGKNVPQGSVVYVEFREQIVD